MTSHVWWTLFIELMFCTLLICSVLIVRRSTNRNQQKNESLFKNVMEFSGSGISLVDRHGRWFKVNDAFSKITGYTIDEMMQLTYQDITHPDDLSKDVSLANQVALGQITSYNIEKRYIRKDGTPIWILLTVSGYYSPSGEFEFYIAHAQDIDARKKAEEQLAESEALFRSVMANTAVGTGLLTPNGDWITANQTLCDLLDYTYDEITHMNYKSITHPMDLPDEILLKERIIKGEISSFKKEKRYFRKDGSIIWALLSIGSFRDKQNKLLYLIDSIENITNHKKLELLLAESEARWHFALESANQGVWDWDVARKKVFFSATWKKMLGYREDEIGNDQSEFESRVHPDDLGRMRQALQAHFDGKTEDYQCEVRFRGKDGEYHWMLDRGKVIQRASDASVLRAIGTHTDITHLKETEASLHQAVANVERSNQELETFAYVASHDLQQPLRTISSYVQLLEKKFTHKTDPEALAFMQYILKGTHDMQTLIKDLLNYCQMTSTPFSLSEVDCNQVIVKVIHTLESLIREKRAIVHYDVLPKVNADATQLLQIFQNLIGNAIKFCEHDPLVHISVIEHAKTWQFLVKDNGVGIPKVDLDKIFIMFKRLQPAKYQGSGIGLAICKRIVERFGGHFGVDSKVGKGSTFYFTLPK